MCINTINHTIEELVNVEVVFLCLDVDECIQNQHNCHKEARCKNTFGSYVCECNMYHTGNGTFCTGIPSNKTF